MSSYFSPDNGGKRNSNNRQQYGVSKQASPVTPSGSIAGVHPSYQASVASPLHPAFCDGYSPSNETAAKCPSKPTASCGPSDRTRGSTETSLRVLNDLADDSLRLLRPADQPSRLISDVALQSEWTGKRYIWVPHCSEGFVLGQIVSPDSDPHDMLTVKINDTDERMKISKEDCQKANPPKFSKVEDMADLTCLNEASVLFNLKERYYSGLIYTYSGLFCVVINPYRQLRIYGEAVMEQYRGQRVQSVPPHIFAITDKAYRSMLEGREDQSILCTGESGAGKTENTKKVIQYMAFVAGSAKTSSRPSHRSALQLAAQRGATLINVGELELQLLQANPILESFGNAKTVKNDNSSRFGKFIRVNFDSFGYIAGASIETYLLEKSRTIRQAKDERSFHIFYQLLKGADETMIRDFLLVDFSHYNYITNGYIDLPGNDDSREFENTIRAMNIMSISGDDLNAILRTVSAVLLMGNMNFKQERNFDQATLPDDTVAQKVCHLLGMNVADFTRAFLKPKLKVGRDFVTKAQSKEQVDFAVEAISKAVYERMFRWIVQRINRTLDRPKRQGVSFIGILDIAGFEIFSVNSFEQLCINYTNEKLQQLFNHTMFVLEQAEYKKEGIDWKYVDFGLDLKPTIDLIEKQMGILSLLDEECWFPRTTDKSFVEKLIGSLSTQPKFIKPPFNTNYHFSLVHYAGKVDYCADQWIMKNMDPLNDNVVALLQSSSESFIREIWKDAEIVTMAATDLNENTFNVRTNIKKGMFRTVGQTYKEQLTKLMKTLQNTNPNFVRCIIPNHEKRANKIEPLLVLDQLRCNGVLEGIRVCRQGFPNRILFQEFRQRYEIICSNEISRGFTDGKMACKRMIEELDLNENLYRIGQTKVFFRTGVLAHLEEERDVRVTEVIKQLQSLCRGVTARRLHKNRLSQLNAIRIIQRNGRVLLKIRDWSWWRLFTKVKPLLQLSLRDDEIRTKQDELAKARSTLERLTVQINEKDEALQRANEEKNRLNERMAYQIERNAEFYETRNRLQSKKSELEGALREAELRLEEEIEKNNSWESERAKLESSFKSLVEQLEDEEQTRQKLELEKIAIESKLKDSTDFVNRLNDTIAKLSKDKHLLEDRLESAESQQSEDSQRVKDLLKAKAKQDSTLADLEAQLRRECEMRARLEVAVAKLEAEITDLREELGDRDTELHNTRSALLRKETELSSMYARQEEESAVKHGNAREIRELKGQLDDLKDDLEAEREVRRRVEREKRDLAEENEALQSEIANHSDIDAVMQDQQRRRDEELAGLRQKLDLQILHHADSLRELKDRHASELASVADQLEAMKRENGDLEKDRRQMQDRLDSAEEELLSRTNDKKEMSRRVKQLDTQLAETVNRLLEIEQVKADIEERLQATILKADGYHSALVECEARLQSMDKSGLMIRHELAENQKAFEEESSKKLALQSALRKVEEQANCINEALEQRNAELERADQRILQLSSQLADEKQRMQEMVQSSVNEANKMYERERDTLHAELQQLKAQLERSDMIRKKLQNELSDANVENEKFRSACVAFEKTQKNVDRKLNDEKTQQDKLRTEIDALGREARERETKLLSLNYDLAERDEELRDTKQRLRQTQAELDALLNRKDDDGRNVHELERAKRNLEKIVEEQKQRTIELEDELSLAETAKLRSDVNLNALRQQMDRQSQESTEANDERHRATMKQLRDLEAELDEERKARTSATTSRNRLELDLADLQVKLADSLKARDEIAKQFKRVTLTCREVTRELDETRNSRDESTNALKELDKRLRQAEQTVQQVQHERELSERARRALASELDEVNQSISLLKSGRALPIEEKRRLEGRVAELEAELEEESSQHDASSQMLRKINAQCEQLTAELTVEKSRYETMKASLDKQNRELKQKIIELEELSRSSNKSAMPNMEVKIQRLEEQLDNEQKERQKVNRLTRQLEKKLREVTLQAELDKGTCDALKEQLEKSSGRIRALKVQLDENEEQASRVRNKLKKTQREKEEADEIIAIRDQRIKHMESRLNGSTWKAIKKTITSEIDLSDDDSSSQRSQTTTLFYSRNGSKEQSPSPHLQ